MRLPVERAEFTEAVKGESDYTRRRFRIRKEDLEKFGHTIGCPGCRAVNRGTTAANHSEEHRKRIAEEVEKVGDERLVRETERLFEYLEEEESKKKRARVSEDKGESMPSASSRERGGERSKEECGRLGGICQETEDQRRRESGGQQEPRRRCGHQAAPCCERDWSSIDE